MKIASPLTTEAHPILQWIEVASSLNIPNFHIIGLAAPEVSEARERVRAAIETSGFEFPRRRVIVNLSPASIRKRGTGSDLGIALAILLNASEEPSSPLTVVASGELGLDGSVKPVGQITRTLYASWQAGIERLVLSAEDYPAAVRCVDLLKRSKLFPLSPPGLIPVRNLQQAWDSIQNSANGIHSQPPACIPDLLAHSSPLASEDQASETAEAEWSLLPLRPDLERWVQVAAAGQHHLLLLGPRGTGKSHALEWLIRLQPKASVESQVQNLLIRELRGSGPQIQDNSAQDDRPPLRRVGVQVRPAALIGGTQASWIRPGEFSLAHGGILLADELPEWSRDSRETLREPMERGRVTISRIQASVELPADFALIANGNLCPCGGWPRRFGKAGSRRKGNIPPCRCRDAEVVQYLHRLSGPVLDRIDITAIVRPQADPGTHSQSGNARERYAELRRNVDQARELSISLWGAPAGKLSAQALEHWLKDHPTIARYINERGELSLRSRHKVLRVAMTAAVLDYIHGDGRTPDPDEEHIEEAFYQRPEGLNLIQSEALPAP